MTANLHRAFLDRLTRLPTDYRDYGGEVERWADDKLAYPDCSCGCRHFAALEGKLGADWGVCAKQDGPRFGLLTFEHQAGFGCFVLDDKEPDWMSGPEWKEIKP
jgi:hypothetical protein